MSKNQKLLTKLKRRPKDFTYNEIKVLLESIGCVEDVKGKTSGSRVAFIHQRTGKIFRLHKPHPGNQLKMYQIDEAIKYVNELEVKE